jgi:hypothetical protein
MNGVGWTRAFLIEYPRRKEPKLQLPTRWQVWARG